MALQNYLFCEVVDYFSEIGVHKIIVYTIRWRIEPGNSSCGVWVTNQITLSLIVDSNEMIVDSTILRDGCWL